MMNDDVNNDSLFVNNDVNTGKVIQNICYCKNSIFLTKKYVLLG